MENSKEITYTAMIKKSIDGKGYIGFIKEVPAAISQAKTEEDLCTNLIDALRALHESNRRDYEAKKLLPDFEEVSEKELCI